MTDFLTGTVSARQSIAATETEAATWSITLTFDGEPPVRFPLCSQVRVDPAFSTEQWEATKAEAQAECARLRAVHSGARA